MLKFVRGYLGGKTTLVFALIGLSLAIFFVSLLQHYQERLLQTVLGGQQLELRESSQQLVEDIHQHTADLNLLANLPELKEMRDVAAISASGENSPVKRLNDYFVGFLQAYPEYDQLRLLDNQGQEQINIRRALNQIEVVPSIGLQDKSQRYYVKEVFEQKLQKVYLSRFDLNREFGEVEQPFKPTVRMVRPIAQHPSPTSASVAGLLVANISLESMLEKYRRSLANIWQADVFLLDERGYFIVHPDQALQWGADRGELDNRISQFFPEVWAQLEAGEQVVALPPSEQPRWGLTGYQRGGYFIAHTFELPDTTTLAAVGSGATQPHVYRALMFFPDQSLEPWSLAYHWVWWALLITLVFLSCFSIAVGYTVFAQQKRIKELKALSYQLRRERGDLQRNQHQTESLSVEVRELLRNVRNEAASIVGFADLTQANSNDELDQVKENIGIIGRATKKMLVILDTVQHKLAEPKPSQED